MPRGTANTNDDAAKTPGPFVVLRPLDADRVTAPEGAENGADAMPAFEVVGEYAGKTSKQAIGHAVAAHGGGTYVAIPKRSFTPRSVESVGVPRLKWS